MDLLVSGFVGPASGTKISKAEQPHWISMAQRLRKRFEARERATTVLETSHFETPCLSPSEARSHFFIPDGTPLVGEEPSDSDGQGTRTKVR